MVGFGQSLVETELCTDNFGFGLPNPNYWIPTSVREQRNPNFGFGSVFGRNVRVRLYPNPGTIGSNKVGQEDSIFKRINSKDDQKLRKSLKLFPELLQRGRHP